MNKHTSYVGRITEAIRADTLITGYTCVMKLFKVLYANIVSFQVILLANTIVFVTSATRVQLHIVR